METTLLLQKHASLLKFYTEKLIESYVHLSVHDPQNRHFWEARIEGAQGALERETNLINASVDNRNDLSPLVRVQYPEYPAEALPS